MRQNNNQNKDLQEIKIRWDHNLVKQLMKEATFNHEDIKKIMIDDHGVVNRKVIKKKYKDLEQYGDLFGLPVWALMSEDTAQEVMRSVKDDLDKYIQPFRISDLEETLNYISEQTESLSLGKDNRTHVQLIVETLKKILERHERWSNTWQVLFSLNRDRLKEPKDYEWICNLLFTYNCEVIYRGTLRFYQKSLTDLPEKPLNMIDSFKTSWFFVKKIIPAANKPRLILSIVDDISTEIFGCQQPNISMSTENEDEMLFSWNPNFKEKVITLPDLTSNFRDRMRNLNKISKYTVFNINEFFYRNEFEQTRSLVEDTTSKNQTMDNYSRVPTLDFLLINGYINSGDHILFKNRDGYSDYEAAEIIITNNRTMLLWRGDIYYLTTLTNNLLSNRHKETPPNYCAKYWYFPGRQHSLYEIANFIKMIYKF
ncbi:MAG: hypothetical protein AB2392_16975 [Neobacillus sp.]